MATLVVRSRRVIPDPAQRAVAFKAVKFAMVGVINVAIDLGVFSFFYYYHGFSIFASSVREWVGLLAYQLAGKTDALFPAR